MFMTRGGTLTLTSVSGNLTGTLTNVTFAEVIIHPDYTTVLVPGGCTSFIASMSFNVQIK